MMRTMTSMRGLALSALTALAGLALASPAVAAPVFCGTNQICYDDLSGTFIDWTDINETIQTLDDAPATALDGLYGEPTASGGGNNVIFDPNSFDASPPGLGAVASTRRTRR